MLLNRRVLYRSSPFYCLLTGLVLALAVPSPAQQEAGVCARVRIKLSQEVAITRTAFRATLEITNAPENVQLQNVSVSLDIRDDADQPSNVLFGIKAPELTGIGDVTGTGVIAPGTTAKAVWTMIPTRDAAPDHPTQYYVGGELSYTEDGTQVNVPLFPAAILVEPDPLLVLDYFLVRDVYSDDPFTPQVEPAEPFPLGLLMRNLGKGTANNVRITSSQPEIVDNEKGLLIDFKIIGTQVNTDQVSPSLSVRLGNIGPGGTAVARWMMTSSLQGKFIEYKATFQHVDDLGDPRLSLIDAVNIHELNHAVRVDTPEDDGKPDFLVNDVSDPDHMPDTLYNSDGTTDTVNLGVSPTVTGTISPTDLEAQLTATVPGGWVYIEANDPGQEQFRLTRVVRSDGQEIRVDDNAWTTHRTIRLVNQPPYRQHLVHVFDKDSTGSYTLIYEQIAAGEMSTGEAKLLADGQQANLGGSEGLAVTALFPDCMYLESLDRSAGIKTIGMSAFEGERVAVQGTMGTASNGERQLTASQLVKVGSGTLKPLALNLRALWGGDFNYSSTTGAGQKGTAGGAGLNTIGLYVITTGKVLSSDAASFVLGDGSGQHDVKVILADGMTPPAVDLFVRVIGVVSVEKVGSDLYPVIRVRRPEDVFAYNSGPTITNVQVTNVGSTSADVSWSTDRMSTSVVLLGTESGVYTQTINGPDFVTGHTVQLTGLLPSTQYYFVVESKDYWMNVTTRSEEQTFTTSDAQLPVLSLTFASASQTGGTVTASAQLSNTGGSADEVKIIGIEASPTSVVSLTPASPAAPLTFGTGSLPEGGSVTTDLQFGTTLSSFYARLTLTYRDSTGVVRTITTPWKKIVLP